MRRQPAWPSATAQCSGVQPRSSRGSTIALIEGALEGDERSLIDAISAVLGSQRLAGDSLAPSGEVTPLGGGEPGALPATSNGGVAESDGGTPAWVWGVIAAVAVSAIAAIGGGPRSTETRHFGKYDWTSAPSAWGSASLLPTR